MLEVGQIFNKNNRELCVIDFLDYNDKKYVLMSVDDGKIEYLFYEINQAGNNYWLNLVKDDNINFELFSIMEGRL